MEFISFTLDHPLPGTRFLVTVIDHVRPVRASTWGDCPEGNYRGGPAVSNRVDVKVGVNFQRGLDYHSAGWVAWHPATRILFFLPADLDSFQYDGRQDLTIRREI